MLIDCFNQMTDDLRQTTVSRDMFQQSEAQYRAVIEGAIQGLVIDRKSVV